MQHVICYNKKYIAGHAQSGSSPLISRSLPLVCSVRKTPAKQSTYRGVEQPGSSFGS